jgi:hypothetical protein
MPRAPPAKAGPSAVGLRAEYAGWNYGHSTPRKLAGQAESASYFSCLTVQERLLLGAGRQRPWPAGFARTGPAPPQYPGAGPGRGVPPMNLNDLESRVQRLDRLSRGVAKEEIL